MRNYILVASVVLLCLLFNAESNDIKGIKLGINHTISHGPLQFSNGIFWEPVCADIFNDITAKVICHQLGFQYYGNAFSTYQNQTIKVGYINVQCNGSEENIQQCTFDHGSCSNDQWITLGCDVGGVKVTCNRHSMMLTINASSIPGFFQSRHFTLLDSNCFAAPSREVIELVTNFDDCGTKLTVTNDSFIYNNQADGVVNLVNSFITRNRNMTFPFECIFSRAVTTGQVTFQQEQQHNNIRHIGYGHIDVIIKFFRSSNFTDFSVDKESDQVFSKNMIYFEVSTNIHDPKLKLITDTCVATPSPNAKDEISYVFLENGCILDETLKRYETNESWVEKFSIEAFHFDGLESSPLIFHCNVFLCDATKFDTRCLQGCIQPRNHYIFRRKRQIYKHWNMPVNRKSFTQGTRIIYSD